MNKSQAIRDALNEFPDKSPKEIAELLAEQGIKINAQYVSTIKSNAKVKAKGKRTVLRRKPTGSNESPMTAALAFIRASGGLNEAKIVLQTVEEIALAAR